MLGLNHFLHCASFWRSNSQQSETTYDGITNISHCRREYQIFRDVSIFLLRKWAGCIIYLAVLNIQLTSPWHRALSWHWSCTRGSTVVSALRNAFCNVSERPPNSGGFWQSGLEFPRQRLRLNRFIFVVCLRLGLTVPGSLFFSELINSLIKVPCKNNCVCRPIVSWNFKVQSYLHVKRTN